MTALDLDGATTAPPLNAECSNAGEFAAAWNAATAEQRENFVYNHNRSTREAIRCFMEGHPLRSDTQPTESSTSDLGSTGSEL